jgi:hypothetical protein
MLNFHNRGTRVSIHSQTKMGHAARDLKKLRILATAIRDFTWGFKRN